MLLLAQGNGYLVVFIVGNVIARSVMVFRVGYEEGVLHVRGFAA